MKKITLLLLLFVGLTSCSNDSQDETPPEVTYADVKPTQTKYKAYYGEKLVKLGSIASKNAESGSGLEMIKPVSVIYYPRTGTIAFSNIFDNTTVEYAVTTKGFGNDSTVYGFKINGVTYTCTITLENSKAVSIIITSPGATYTFVISLAETKNLAKLLVKDVAVSPDPYNNYSTEYIYDDTLVAFTIYKHKDYETLEDLIDYTEYRYDNGKLIYKSVLDKDGVFFSKIKYDYENDLIVRATYTDAGDDVTNIVNYKYDSSKRIIEINSANATGGNSLIRYHSYEKNQLNTIFTNAKETFHDTEVSIYDDQRKPFFVSQEKTLDPFTYLHITKSTYTNNAGQVHEYPDKTYEYSDDGLLIKTVNQETVKTFEYKEEQ